VELAELIAILRRRWWLVVLPPVIAAALLVWQSRARPYQVMVKATVLIPGDTEIPWNSERPELMVMDDAPALVGSRVFAEGVRVAMRATGLTIEEIQSSLQGVRYNRVLTITVTRADPGEATGIAEAVAQSLPDLINRYLIPQGGAPASVHVIDPPSDPSRSRPAQNLKTLVALAAAAALGGGLALLADLVDPRLSGRGQIEQAFAAPVLGDLRRRRRRSPGFRRLHRARPAR
jgi:capsular polysaccharide biosynthesis protein